MTTQDFGAYEELSPGRRRLIVAWTLLRALVTVSVLLALYYLLPLHRRIGVGTVVELVIGLAVVAGVLAWQLRAVIRSRHPRLRAIQALAVAIPLFLLIFACAYFLMARGSAASFGQRLSRTDALYFSVTVFSTVGFGDITARTDGARLVVTAQMLGDLVLLGLGLRLLVGATQVGLHRNEATDGHP